MEMAVHRTNESGGASHSGANVAGRLEECARLIGSATGRLMWMLVKRRFSSYSARMISQELQQVIGPHRYEVDPGEQSLKLE